MSGGSGSWGIHEEIHGLNGEKAVAGLILQLSVYVRMYDRRIACFVSEYEALDRHLRTGPPAAPEPGDLAKAVALVKMVHHLLTSNL